jgi:D-tyrosyl-tRNA(Tyr) deacylase
MRLLIQRVKEASVEVDGVIVSQIGPGLLTLIGVAKGDGETSVRKLVQKAIELRIFEDEEGKMNRSLSECRGEHLIVSQFTLAADCSSGRRPSFTTAERPELAEPLYEKAISISKELGVRTSGGVFGANMAVHLINDGPVTFLLEG